MLRMYLKEDVSFFICAVNLNENYLCKDTLCFSRLWEVACFEVCHFTFTKALHYNLFSLTQGNLKKNFAFTTKGKKAKIAFSVCPAVTEVACIPGREIGTTNILPGQVLIQMVCFSYHPCFIICLAVFFQISVVIW